MSDQVQQPSATPAEPRFDPGSSDSRSRFTPAVRPSGESQTGEERGRGGDHPAGELFRFLKTPAGGATVSGSVVLGAAALFGVLETTLAAGAAYVAYHALRRKRRPTPPRLTEERPTDER